MDQEWTKNGPGLDLDLDLSLTISWCQMKALDL